MLIYRLTRGQLSPFDAQKNVRGYPGIVNDIQPCPKRCLLMPLVRVGVRTDSTTRAVTTRGVANFRARVLAYVQYAPRVCTLVLFIMLVNEASSEKVVSPNEQVQYPGEQVQSVREQVVEFPRKQVQSPSESHTKEVDSPTEEVKSPMEEAHQSAGQTHRVSLTQLLQYSYCSKTKKMQTCNSYRDYLRLRHMEISSVPIAERYMHIKVDYNMCFCV